MRGEKGNEAKLAPIYTILMVASMAPWLHDPLKPVHSTGFPVNCTKYNVQCTFYKMKLCD
jgi:hypothetical protein